MKDGTSRRVRKILAGVPASVSIRDHILALSFSRSKRQHWTVGNRPIRYYDLRSLRRYSAEAQIQDRSRQQDRVKYRPGLFTRLQPNFPFAERRGRVRSTQGMHENHPPPRHSRGPSRHSRKPFRHSRGPSRHSRKPYPVIPADAGTQRKQSTPPQPSGHPPLGGIGLR